MSPALFSYLTNAQTYPSRFKAGGFLTQSTQPSLVERSVSGLIIGFARHWLAIFNGLWALYILLPFAAPVLMQLGFTGPARVIYSIYSYACHQLPDHSYFLFGQTFTPQLGALEAGGMAAGLDLFGQRAFVGGESLGFKVAICQRDVAIYGTVLLAGLLFNFVRHRLQPLNWRLFVLFLVPIALDGGTQLFGLRESDWLLRSLTGALFGLAAVWLAYPHVESAMTEVIEDELKLIEHRAAR